MTPEEFLKEKCYPGNHEDKNLHFLMQEYAEAFHASEIDKVGIKGFPNLNDFENHFATKMPSPKEFYGWMLRQHQLVYEYQQSIIARLQQEKEEYARAAFGAFRYVPFPHNHPTWKEWKENYQSKNKKQKND